MDFRINLLIFESRDAGTFLQRLGRLGRHDNDGRGHTFDHFEAHALVPNFVQERLFVKDRSRPALLSGDGPLTREALSEAVRGAYPVPCEFNAYARTWGPMQTAHVYKELCNPTVKDSYTQAREQLKEQYWRTFGISTGSSLRDYLERRKEAASWWKRRSRFAVAARSNAGSSTCCPIRRRRPIVPNGSKPTA